MRQESNIAIIYFSRTVGQEAEHKTWSAHSSRHQRIAISDFLNSRTLSTLNNSGLEVLHFDESKQKGRHFGEKLANAFESAFNLGFDSIITVGNDCVDLPQVNFNQIVDNLNEGKNILGPTIRKGAYLIGLNKQNFNKKAFQNLAWQSKDLEQDLLAYFEYQGSAVEVLATYRDANNLYDFKQLLKSLGSNAAVLRNLKNFLAFELRAVDTTVSSFVQQRFFNFENLRAPPFGY